MAMSLAAAAASARQCLSDVNPDGSNPFIEKLLVQIYKHFDGQHLIDVTFKLTNPTAFVTAHRLILSAASPYFKELFQSGAGICPLIEISDIDSDTFERLITFCYTGMTLISIDNVESMLKASLILQLDDAVTNCVDFLIEHITDYTLERAYALEREAQCELLSEKILEYERGNFMTVIQSAEFLNFEAGKLQAILKSDDLNVPTEKDVFGAVKVWYEHDASERKQQLHDLIACLRLTQFDTNFLLHNIQPLPGCHFLAVETLTWINCPLARSALSIKYTKPRLERNVMSEESFLALNIEGGESRTIFQYNKTEDLWQKWIDIEIDVIGFRVVFMGDNLIFIGGHRNCKTVNEVRSWNFKTKTFQQLPAMNQPRYWHCVLILDDKIYVIGGKGANYEDLNSVEMYSVSNGWKSINNMIKPRCFASAVVLNKKIYVIGGQNTHFLRSVECFDPTTNCWTQCADMNENHEDPGATVHNGHIFVVGGNTFTTVERFDPQRNEWTKICSLSVGGELIDCISIDNQLWAVGGYKGGYKNNVSVYDEQNDKWIDKKPMPMGGGSRTIFQYNKTEDLWQKWIDIEIDVMEFRVVFMDDNLIFIGGLRNKAINEVRSWNFKTKTFQHLPAMNQPRYWHCVLIVDDKIYVIGGKRANNEYLNSVEMYSVSNGWKSINNMIKPRCFASAVVLNKKIYVIGGQNKNCLRSVECYDPTTNCWTQCADMNEKHANPGATVHNGHIFVVGGYDGNTFTTVPLTTVERFDPQRNEWTKICSLSLGVELIDCISIDNQLWAVGGCNRGYKNNVSVYDEQNDKWIDKKPMPMVGWYYCFMAPKSLLRSE